MIDWLKRGLAARTSTIMGLVAIALALALVAVPLMAPPDKAALVSDNIKWLIGALFAGGLGGVLWRGKGC